MFNKKFGNIFQFAKFQLFTFARMKVYPRNEATNQLIGKKIISQNENFQKNLQNAFVNNFKII
jgi:hypothetical protein